MSDKREHDIPLMDFLRKTFPERFQSGCIYHYSTPNLLETFFSDDADFYCTYYAALNDNHEIVEGWGAVEAYMTEVLGMPIARMTMLKQGYYELFHKDITSPWIMSFSETSDSLPQWTMYTDRLRGGYAFGFDREELRNRIVKVLPVKNGYRVFDMWLTPCFYDVESVQKIFNFYFSKHRDEIKHFATAETVSPSEVLNLASRVSIIATLVKHSSFASEREWRLMKCPYGPMFETCSFIGDKPRHKTGMFSSCLPLRDFIREIVVSPHGDKRVLGMNAAIYAQKYHLCIDVTDSNSPYNGR